jgi:hypothetical protein
MAKSDVIVLEAYGVTFWSDLDEDAFFGWLDKIPCVLKFDGVGRMLNIYVSNKKLNQYSLRELLAIFYRYKINMKQFIVFDCEEYAEWFRGEQKYWYKGVFGSKSNKAKKSNKLKKSKKSKEKT